MDVVYKLLMLVSSLLWLAVPSIGLQMLPAGSMDTDSSYGSTIGQGRSPTHSGRLENLASGRSGVAVPEDYPEVRASILTLENYVTEMCHYNLSLKSLQTD